MDINDKEHDFLKDAFSPTGYFAQHFPGYQPREGQVHLAYEVHAGMLEGYHVMAEAPTGTGKSLGYGVPATLQAARGENVVIVTANIALQEQLVKKDLPMLQEILPWEFEFAIAKGLNNYLCLDKFAETENDTILSGYDGTPKEKTQWNEVIRWAAQTTQGDISELAFEPSQSMRGQFTVMSEDCIGKKCKYHADCHGIRARRRMSNAQVVVTNYALFFADLTIKRGGAPGVLPKYTHVIFDEGHQAADLARSFMGWRCSRGGLAFATKLLDHPQDDNARKGYLPSIDAALKDRTLRAADNLFAQVTTLFHSEEYDTRLQRKWGGALLKKQQELSARLGECATAFRNAASNTDLTEARAAELNNMAGKCAEHSTHLRQVAEFETAGNWVFFLEEKNDSVSVNGLPISVADNLRDMLFEYNKGEDAVKHVTVTSATLATKVGDYSFTSNQLGLKGAAEETVDTPFDLAGNTMLVLPSMPTPQHKNYVSAVADRIEEAVEQAKGRTLCLFTSYRNMNAVYEKIGHTLPYTVLKQGDAPRMQLIDRFKEDVSSVLFGTDSFWAGVDVPGEALSCLVIDKLPFPNFGDPVQDALKAQLGRDYFFRCSVPAAVIKFRQGVGRLIRSVNDRGVIVVLDSRVREKSYGKSFTRSFPQGTEIVRDMGCISSFLY